MTLYAIAARVRVRGAIGIFYLREFLCDSLQGETVVDAWLRAFGADWELERILGAHMVAGDASARDWGIP